ncbi:MAG: lysophospholipid acyltransferase family protein [Patulibacter sp.]|nr:lysophospholipid acyltransferase family protein [Patulibacter sp.]
MRWLEGAIAASLSRLPNRKFATTWSTVRRAGLVSAGQASSFRREHVGFISSYYVHFFRLLSRRYRIRTLGRVRAYGERHLLDVQGRGTGAILVSAHLGDFDAAGAWMVHRHGITPVVVSNPIRPRWREFLFCSVRRRCGVLVRSTRTTSLVELGEDIAAGRWVLCMLDRATPGPSFPGTFLDRASTIPAAIAILALRTGAPLVPAVTWRDVHGNVAVWFGEPIAANSRSAAFRALSLALKQVELRIRRHPDQWHVPADVRQLPWGPLAPAHGGDRRPRRTRTHSSPETAEPDNHGVPHHRRVAGA